jgi:hypothetical protein
VERQGGDKAEKGAEENGIQYDLSQNLEKERGGEVERGGGRGSEQFPVIGHTQGH